MSKGEKEKNLRAAAAPRSLEGSAPPGGRSPASEPEGSGSGFPLKGGRVSREHTGKARRRAAGSGEFGERAWAAGVCGPGVGRSGGLLC